MTEILSIGSSKTLSLLFRYVRHRFPHQGFTAPPNQLDKNLPDIKLAVLHKLQIYSINLEGHKNFLISSKFVVFACWWSCIGKILHKAWDVVFVKTPILNKTWFKFEGLNMFGQWIAFLFYFYFFFSFILLFFSFILIFSLSIFLLFLQLYIFTFLPFYFLLFYVSTFLLFYTWLPIYFFTFYFFTFLLFFFTFVLSNPKLLSFFSTFLFYYCSIIIFYFSIFILFYSSISILFNFSFLSTFKFFYFSTFLFSIYFFTFVLFCFSLF